MKYLIQYDTYKEDNAEYSFKYKDDTVKMYYSGGHWNHDIQNSTCAKLDDTGDGIHIKIKGVNRIKLDYADTEILYVLLTNFVKEVQTAKPKIYKLENSIVN